MVHESSLASSRRRMIVLSSVAVFLYWVSMYIYAPTLPTYIKSKTNDLALVGAVLSMYGLWQAIIRVPLGITSDWLGRRKPFILVGFALTGLGAYVMAVAPNVNGLMLGRAITGLAAGTWVPLVVLFSSLFPARDAVRASALLTMVGSVARMIATALTGTLNQVGGYALAFYLAAGAAALALLVFLPTKELTRPPKAPSLGGLFHLATRRDVFLPSLLSLVSQYANWGATFGFVPILAQQLGASGVMQSLLMSMNIAVLTVGNLFTTAIARRFGARRLVYASFLLLGMGLGGASLAPSLPWIFGAQFCMGLAQGIGYPVLMGLSIQDVSEHERTTAMGLHQAIYAIGMFAGPALSGVLAGAIGIQPMFAVTAAVCLLLGLLGARLLVSAHAT